MFRETLNALREMGWTKWTRQDNQGKMCLLGGMGFTVNDVWWVEHHAEDKINQLAEVIVTQYPDRVGHGFFCHYPAAVVATFNNNNNTTWTDIERVLEKATIIEEETV